MRDALFQKGLRLRKQVIGAEYVERSLQSARRAGRGRGRGRGK